MGCIRNCLLQECTLTYMGSIRTFLLEEQTLYEANKDMSVTRIHVMWGQLGLVFTGRDVKLCQ
jgi:hypothetical protein